MMVAGLDIATHTGIALGAIGTSPRLWSVNLGSGQGHDARFSAMLGLVHGLLADHGVTHLALEAPVQARVNTTASNALLMGLSAIVRAWGWRKGVPVTMFPPQTVARHFVGHGGLKRKAKKAAVIAQCHARGWHPADDNQADAAAVWDLMCSRLNVANAMSTQPHPIPEVGR